MAVPIAASVRRASFAHVLSLFALLCSSTALAQPAVVPNNAFPNPVNAGDPVSFWLMVPASFGPASNGCTYYPVIDAIVRDGYDVRFDYHIAAFDPPPVICTATPPGVAATFPLGAFLAPGTYHVRGVANIPAQLGSVPDVNATFVVLGTGAQPASVPGLDALGRLLLVAAVIGATLLARARRRASRRAR